MAVGMSRPVNETIWLDKKFRKDLENWERYVFLYILTNSHLEQVGIYELDIDTIVFETQLKADEIIRALKKLEDVGLIFYDYETCEIAIKNYLKYSLLKGGSPAEKCFLNLGKKVKSKKLLIQMYNNAKDLNDERPIYSFALNKLKEAINYDSDSNNKFMTEEEERCFLEDEIVRIEEFAHNTNNKFILEKIRSAVPEKFCDKKYDINHLKDTLSMLKHYVGE